MIAIVIPITWKLNASLIRPLTTSPTTAPREPKNTCQVTMLTLACGPRATSGSSDSNGPPERVENRRCSHTKKKKYNALAKWPASPPGGNHISANVNAYTGVEKSTNGMRLPQRVRVLSLQKPINGSSIESMTVIATIMKPRVNRGTRVGRSFSQDGGGKKKTSPKGVGRGGTIPAMLPEA